MSTTNETFVPNIDMNELLASHKEEIGRSLKAAIVERLKEILNWSLSNQISETAKTFVETELGPELRKYLDEHRSEILQQLTTGLGEVFGVAIRKMIEEAAKNLSSGYNIGKVVDAMFR